MLTPILILTGIMTALTAPGLIAMHLEDQRNAKGRNL